MQILSDPPISRILKMCLKKKDFSQKLERVHLIVTAAQCSMAILNTRAKITRKGALLNTCTVDVFLLHSAQRQHYVDPDTLKTDPGCRINLYLRD